MKNINKKVLEKKQQLKKLEGNVKAIMPVTLSEKLSFTRLKKENKFRSDGFSDATASNFWSSWGDSDR